MKLPDCVKFYPFATVATVMIVPFKWSKKVKVFKIFERCFDSHVLNNFLNSRN